MDVMPAFPGVVGGKIPHGPDMILLKKLMWENQEFDEVK